MYCNPHTAGDDRTSICSPVSYECHLPCREPSSPSCRQKRCTKQSTGAECSTAAEAERQVSDSAAVNAGIFADGTGPYSPHRGKAPAVSASAASLRSAGGNSFCCAFNPVPTRRRYGMPHRHTVLRIVRQRTPSCPLLFEVIARVSHDRQTPCGASGTPPPTFKSGSSCAKASRGNAVLAQETRFS